MESNLELSIHTVDYCVINILECIRQIDIMNIWNI